MASLFHSLEESLKEYLAESQTDRYNSKNANFYKYNNLKIFMEPGKVSTPHFGIRIGISEAIYDIEKCEKIAGGLGSDERYIRRWIERNAERFDWTAAWKKTVKPKAVKIKKDAEDDDDD